MRLLDRVAQARDAVRVARPGQGLWELPGAASLAAEVADAPLRYVLADEVREACHEIAGRWPELMDPGSGSLRLPVPKMWIEWSEPGESGSRRTGMLVRAGSSDRDGTLHLFWEDGATGAERAQAHLRFDLDHVLAGPDAASVELARFPALRLLAPHFLITIEPEWLRYFAATRLDANELKAALARCSAQALPAFPFLVALLRLLAVRRNVAETHVTRAELNRARARRGKPPLLDHVEVALAIGSAAGSRDARVGVRAPSRQHVVRGHLVRRHGSIFWRSAHLRGRALAGSGPLKRYIRLSVAPGFRPRPGHWPEELAAE